MAEEGLGAYPPPSQASRIPGAVSNPEPNPETQTGTKTRNPTRKDPIRVTPAQ